jgi:hypothetical protein
MGSFGIRERAFGCLRNLCSKGGKEWGLGAGRKKINPLSAGCLISGPSPEFVNLLRPCPSSLQPHITTNPQHTRLNKHH